MNNMNTANNNQTIDFLPDEVLHARRERAQYGELLKVGVALLIIATLLSVGLYVYKLILKKDLDAVKNEISTETRDIDSMKNIAESGYTLGVRLKTLEKILDNRIVYSKLMNEIRDKTPTSIMLGSITLSDSTNLVLDGSAKSVDYTPIAEFKKTLSSSDLFSDIKVLKASGDSKEITFSVSTSLDIEKLKETISSSNNDGKVSIESSSENSLK